MFLKREREREGDPSKIIKKIEIEIIVFFLSPLSRITS